MKVSFFFGTFKILKDQLEMQFSTPKNDKKFETPLGVEVLWWGGGCEKMVTWGYISGPGMFLFKALLRDDRSIKNRVLNEVFCLWIFFLEESTWLFVSSATWDDPTKVSGREATTTGGGGETSTKKTQPGHTPLAYQGWHFTVVCPYKRWWG